MRIVRSIILAITAIFAATASHAQTYDPRFPVCMKVIQGGGRGGGGEWIDCSYATMNQCQASASGRAAMCMINPYGSLGTYRVAPRARRPAAYQ
jgi:hypothetical protein